MVKNGITFPDIVVSTVCCFCVKHPAHRHSKSRVYPLRCQDSGPPTRSYTAAAAGWCCSPVVLLMWFRHTHAHKNCASDLWMRGIQNTSKDAPGTLRSKQALTSTISQ